MHNHIRSEGSNALPIDWLATPGLAFSLPNEVLDHPELSNAERRAILASWASDARAVEAAHWMRRLDNGSMVALDEVLQALRKLDAHAAARGRERTHSNRDKRRRIDFRKYASSSALRPHEEACR
jgi:hypothetical protein